MYLENPVDYVENPYGYYIVDVKGPRGHILTFKATGPLAKAQSYIRARLRRMGVNPRQITLRSHIFAYVR